MNSTSLGAGLGLVTATVAGVRYRDPDRVTNGFPWGYRGVGWGVGAVGFGCAALASSTPAGWSDLREAIPVLIVASAGFGMLHQFVEQRFDRSVSWVAPLALSLALGVLIALAE